MKLAIVILLIVIALLVVILVVFAETVPPDAMTRTRMRVLEQRICKYAKDHYMLPKTLADLPSLDEPRDDSICDGWGRTIQYETSADGTVRLTSLGSDNATGGRRLATDITITFSCDDN